MSKSGADPCPRDLPEWRVFIRMYKYLYVSYPSFPSESISIYTSSYIYIYISEALTSEPGAAPCSGDLPEWLNQLGIYI